MTGFGVRTSEQIAFKGKGLDVCTLLCLRSDFLLEAGMLISLEHVFWRNGAVNETVWDRLDKDLHPQIAPTASGVPTTGNVLRGMLAVAI